MHKINKLWGYNCTTQGIEAMLYYYHKWNITFKNHKLLYCTSITCIIYINCMPIKTNKQKKKWTNKAPKTVKT